MYVGSSDLNYACAATKNSSHVLELADSAELSMMLCDVVSSM
jgi:hypothetical protein